VSLATGTFLLTGRDAGLRRLRTSLLAEPTAYTFVGNDASLLLDWGGDADFAWAAPTTEGNILAAAEVTGIVSSADSRFRWE